jgi:Uma2 family endonuclease
LIESTDLVSTLLGGKEDRTMATVPRSPSKKEVDYPTSDGKPMAETGLHWQVMVDAVETMRDHFVEDPMVHVGGNLLLYYEEDNRRKHVAPDAFMVRGIPRLPLLDYYLLWKHGKPPDVVIEITSKTTKREDQKTKRVLYRDVLKIPEYFQFDPTEDYLKPSLQGVRRVGDEYVMIDLVDGRLPSVQLGLHLERSGEELRFWDPILGRRLLTPKEQRDLAQQHVAELARRAEQEKTRAEAVDQRRLSELQTAADAQQRLQDENERLRREIEALRRGHSGANGH